MHGRPPRLDERLVAEGLAPDIKEAAALVMAGRVRVDGRRVDKPGARVKAGLSVAVEPKANPYVGRGGLKLRAALELSGLPVQGRHCLDVGASTGGFTHCLLERGAAAVASVDTGHGQLHPLLRQDPRVTCLERTDAARLSPADLPFVPDFLCMDVSFTSSARLLPKAAALLAPGAAFVVLVKPQFELPRGLVPPGGVVADQALRRQALEGVHQAARQAGLEVLGAADCPVAGAEGNVEWLLWGRKGIVS